MRKINKNSMEEKNVILNKIARAIFTNQKEKKKYKLIKSYLVYQIAKLKI